MIKSCRVNSFSTLSGTSRGLSTNARALECESITGAVLTAIACEHRFERKVAAFVGSFLLVLFGG